MHRAGDFQTEPEGRLEVHHQIAIVPLHLAEIHGRHAIRKSIRVAGIGAPFSIATIELAARNVLDENLHMRKCHHVVVFTT